MGYMEGARLSSRETECLYALHTILLNSDNASYARTVAKKVGIEENKARNALRSLKRKGFVDYQRGLFDDEGKVAGSGWRVNLKGSQIIPEEVLWDLANKLPENDYDVRLTKQSMINALLRVL